MRGQGFGDLSIVRAYECYKKETPGIEEIKISYEIGIVQQLQSTARINNAFAYRFVKQLTDDYGLSRANADWVVSVWFVCYGKNILGKECEIAIQSGKGPAITPEQPALKKYELLRKTSGKRKESLLGDLSGVYGTQGCDTVLCI